QHSNFKKRFHPFLQTLRQITLNNDELNVVGYYSGLLTHKTITKRASLINSDYNMPKKFHSLSQSTSVTRNSPALRVK
ncbi:MAG: hypothetical protein L0K92_09650, partial [Enterobacterales bacterium]|nr:hypothetical protein [Enterobacterales bacterium]